MISDHLTQYGGVALQSYGSNGQIPAGLEQVGLRIQGCENHLAKGAPEGKEGEKGEERGLAALVMDRLTGGRFSGGRARKVPSFLSAVDLLEKLERDPGASKVSALVIGQWEGEYQSTGDGPEKVVEALVGMAGVLTGLRHLFIGDLTSEECEISWITQGEMGRVLKAYPNLVTFGVRGGESLSFKGVKEHRLESLTVETGGLGKGVIAEICAVRWPGLKTLELWTGSDNYGGDSGAQDLAPILDGGNFPSLVNLRIKDSPYADQAAEALVKSRIFERLQTLDLGMGTLGEVGARALLESPGTRRLQALSIDHHYVPEELVESLKGLGIKVSAEERQDPDDNDGDRYIAVSE